MSPSYWLEAILACFMTFSLRYGCDLMYRLTHNISFYPQGENPISALTRMFGTIYWRMEDGGSAHDPLFVARMTLMSKEFSGSGKGLLFVYGVCYAFYHFIIVKCMYDQSVYDWYVTL